MNSTTSTTSTYFNPNPHSPTKILFNWNCPHCDRATTITNSNAVSSANVNTLLPECGGTVFISTFIKCPNQDCNKISLIATENKVHKNPFGPYIKGEELKRWQLIPKSTARTWPDNVPVAIRQDYSEAVLICELSPKASATLSRRCLQGIIRNVYKVNENSLVKEIDKIKDKVDEDTLEIIKMIRKAGNIGAHTEKDISIIIDINPGDARILIQLIETLIQKWYIDDPKYKKAIENFNIRIEKKI